MLFDFDIPTCMCENVFIMQLHHHAMMINFTFHNDKYNSPIIVATGESVGDWWPITCVLGIIIIVEDGDMESTIKNNSYFK